MLFLLEFCQICYFPRIPNQLTSMAGSTQEEGIRFSISYMMVWVGPRSLCIRSIDSLRCCFKYDAVTWRPPLCRRCLASKEGGLPPASSSSADRWWNINEPVTTASGVIFGKRRLFHDCKYEHIDKIESWEVNQSNETNWIQTLTYTLKVIWTKLGAHAINGDASNAGRLDATSISNV